jgi:hypothetical protein
MNINTNYLNLKDSYLFSTVAKKVKEFQLKNPDRTIYRLGIGDVTLPLVPAVIEAMEKAVAEMGEQNTFRGYGEEQGYVFYGAISPPITQKKASALILTRYSSATARKATLATYLISSLMTMTF